MVRGQISDLPYGPVMLVPENIQMQANDDSLKICIFKIICVLKGHFHIGCYHGNTAEV